MRPAITFEKVVNTDQFTQLKAFAASFGHTVDDQVKTPVFLMRRGSKLFGFFSVAPFAILFPNFHEQYTSPRDFVEAGEQLKAMQWIATSGNERYPKGISFVAAKTNKKTERAMEKLGYRKVADLWEAIG